MRRAVLFFILLLFMESFLFAQSSPQHKAISDLKSSIEELSLVRSRIRKERILLESKLTQLRREVKTLEKEVAKKQGILSGLRNRERELVLKKVEGDREMKSLLGNFRLGVKDLKDTISNSPLLVLNPEVLGNLEKYLSQSFYPGPGELKKVFSLYESSIITASSITKKRLSFVWKDGTLKKGDVLFLGPFTCVYKAGKNVGFLKFDSSKLVLSSMVEAPSWRVRRVLSKFIEGSGRDAYLDVSGGKAIFMLRNRLGFSEQVRRGGPIAIIILVLGVFSLVIVAERFLFLRRIDVDVDKDMSVVEKFLREGMLDKAKSFLSRKNVPVYRVLLSCLESLHLSKDGFEEEVERAMSEEVPKIERFLSTLSVIAAVSPLLGLLGTVTGMIKTFHVITLFGSRDPRMMAGGISEALITTEFGLMVAIPVLFFHNLLSRKVEAILDRMEKAANRFVDILSEFRNV